ncbi:MAG: Chondroitin synthase [Syntrophomonadaceae bacterium]|nr:Chondroitin synthase [Bacillota bacterium]
MPAPCLTSVADRPNKTEIVSILIPTYNSARFVARAIESALDQSYRPVEIVIVDNASSDNTYEIVESYAAKYGNIRIFQNAENVGPARNWEICAQMAQGSYACLLFSDDWYERSFLEETIPHLRDQTVGFVYTSVSCFSEGSSEPRILYRRSETGGIPVARFVKEHLYLGYAEPPLSPCCALFRHSDLISALSVRLPDDYRVGYLQHGAGPDLLVYLLTSTRYESFAYVDKPLVNFQRHAKNLSRNKTVNLAYALSKAWFACKFGGHFDDEFDPRKFRAAHLWRLLRRRNARIYPSSLSGDGDRWDIAWGYLMQYMATRVLREEVWEVNGLQAGLINQFRAVVDLQLPAFKRQVPPGSVGQLAFEPCTAETWYLEFRNRIVSAMGNSYLPVYRMADGEFIFCVGRKYETAPLDEPAGRRMWTRAKELIASTVNRFRSAEKTCWGEQYVGVDKGALMRHYVGCLQRVSQCGMLAVHFVRSPKRFAEQYIQPMCEWFAENRILLDRKNYTSFYFVYALLCGPDSRMIFEGRRVLVVTSADAVKRTRIIESLTKLGAEHVQFLSISPNRSLIDKIDIAQVNGHVDIALIAGGIGSVNILDQLAPLNTVCIDAGICVECFADPSRRKERIFLQSDDDSLW